MVDEKPLMSRREAGYSRHPAVARVAFVLGVARVHRDDPSGHATRFRIPAHVVADFEGVVHGGSKRNGNYLVLITSAFFDGPTVWLRLRQFA